MTSRQSHRFRRRRRCRPLIVERLEARRVLASFVVDMAQDIVDPNDGQTSLREAVQLANDAPGADTISFDPGAFALPATIELALGELLIEGTVDLDGPEATLTLVAGENSRLLNVSSQAVDVTLRRLTLTGGATSANNQGGGAIRFISGGTLRLDDVTVVDNHTTGQSSAGGAILVLGTLNLVRTRITDNATEGALSSGGAIYHRDGDLAVLDSEVSANRTLGINSDGGGIDTDTTAFSLLRSVVANNQTQANDSEGGGLSLRGQGSIAASVITGNRTLGDDADGGGIRSRSNLTVIDSRIDHNTTAGSYSAGGGIASSDAELTITGSSVTENETSGSFSDGGGILAVRGTVSITGTTLTDNVAGGSSSDGGGLASFFSDVVVLGSTVAENSALGNGGGVTFVGNQVESLSILNTMVAANQDSGIAADLFIPQSLGALTVNSSLIGDNAGSGLSESQTPDGQGNLIGAEAGSGAIDPHLGALFLTGRTYARPLEPSSPAIDAGDDALVQSSFDVRGEPFPRIVGSQVDIGAYEFQLVDNASLVVTTETDTLDFSDGVVSLREALQVADGNPGPDIVSFAGSKFDQPVTLGLTRGQLNIYSSVNILGTGRDRLVIDAQQGSRVLNIWPSAGDVTLSQLSISGGRTTGDHLGTSVNGTGGGGIRFASSGTLTINDSALIDNQTRGILAHGGGLALESGSLILNGSTFIGNQTWGNRGGGGAISIVSGQATIDNSLFSANQTHGDDAAGGAILSSPLVDLFVSATQIADNRTGGARSVGGGIAAGAATLRNSTLARNQTAGADSHGGGIYAPQLDLLGVTLSTNQAGDPQSIGGGVWSGQARVVYSTIAENQAGVGGGIAIGGVIGTGLELVNSIVATNVDRGAAPDIAFPPDQTDSLVVLSSLIGDNRGTGLAASHPVPDANGNLIGTIDGIVGLIDPQLLPLARLGGNVSVHALDPFSSAVNRGDPTFLPWLGEDGRGAPFRRLADARPDLGAYELQSIDPAMLIVDTAVDELDFNNDLTSLREAIVLANGSSGLDLITFEETVFIDPTTIELSLGALTVSESLTIRGPGKDRLSIDALHNSRVIEFDHSSGDLTLSGLTFTGGMTPTAGDGGGVLFASSDGKLSLTDVRLSGNQADGAGGGLFSAGDADVTDSEIVNNQAVGSGGGLSVVAVLQMGSSSVAGNMTTGNAAHGGGLSAATASITGSLIQSNQTTGTDASGGGFAVDYAVVHTSIIRDNVAMAAGGGILAMHGLAVGHSTITDNQSGGDGGGIHALTQNGIPVQIDASGITNNRAQGDGARGGGVFVTGSAWLFDNTISGNHASGSGSDGGGLYLGEGDHQVMRNTVVSNSASRLGGGLWFPLSPSAPIAIRHSIFAANTDAGLAPNFRATLDPDDLSVTYSLIDDNTGTGLIESQTANVLGNLIGRPNPSGSGVIDPMLSALTVINGAQVHPLLVSSPAIDAGLPDAAVSANDQRGAPFARLFGSAVDMGSFESQPPVEPVIAWDDPPGILVGTPLGAAQLDATAATSGTFTYSPAAESVLSEGAGQPLSVDFVPDDATYFLPTSATVFIDVRQGLDFGDAPDSFNTLFDHDGPRHRQSSLTLGAVIDYEIDGVPSPGASLEGGSDDGVSLITPLVRDPGGITTSTLLVTVSASSNLDGWIDFDGSGTFDHPQEHIGGGVSIGLSRGENVVQVQVSDQAMSGQTFARFRISTAGGLLPTGPAIDGEVEDYQWSILDGQFRPVIAVDLRRGATTLTTEANTHVLVGRGGILFRADRSVVGRYQLNGTEFSDVLVIDSAAGDAIPTDGLRYDGDGQINTIRLVGANQTLDTSQASSVDVRNIDVIDLFDTPMQTAVFDAVSAAAMDPTGGGIIVSGGVVDRVAFADPSAWRMGEPFSFAGFNFSTVVTFGTFVQVDFASPWQNLIQASDVGNDGAVTASDALRIINELARRQFSDPDTSDLLDPSDVLVWPHQYFDQNGDGRATALDALRVINQLSRL